MVCHCMYLPVVVGKLVLVGSDQVHTLDVPSTREEVANALLQNNKHKHINCCHGNVSDFGHEINGTMTLHVDMHTVYSNLVITVVTNNKIM